MATSKLRKLHHVCLDTCAWARVFGHVCFAACASPQVLACDVDTGRARVAVVSIPDFFAFVNHITLPEYKAKMVPGDYVIGLGLGIGVKGLQVASTEHSPNAGIHVCT
jgi:hypothetical protein